MKLLKIVDKMKTTRQISLTLVKIIRGLKMLAQKFWSYGQYLLILIVDKLNLKSEFLFKKLIYSTLRAANLSSLKVINLNKQSK